MSKKLSWTRGENGYTETRCGRFYIDPLYDRQNPEKKLGYELYERNVITDAEHCKGKYPKIHNAKQAAIAVAGAAA